MKTQSILMSLFLASAIFADDGLLFKDDFTIAKLEGRRLSRGDWTIADGVATCTQDDEIFKKYDDHGPIIRYDVLHTNSTVRFSFKPDGAKMFVFTANSEKEHVFRFIITSAGMSIRAFPPDNSGKSIALTLEKVLMKEGEWVTVEVKFEGSEVSVKIGDYPEKKYQDASFDRPKVNLTIGFSYGTLGVKDLLVRK